MKEKIICFDIGESKIAQAVIEIDEDSIEYDFLDFSKIVNPINQKEIEVAILDYCKKSSEKFSSRKVAIASAKIVNPGKKEIFNAGNIYGAGVFSFSFLEKENFDIKLENDGRCFARGENIFGKGQEAESLLALTVGTHVGGGFINKQKNFRGANYSAMEVSYMKILFNKKWQNWGEVIGGKSIEEAYEKRTNEKKETREIFELQKEGNEKAGAVIKENGEFLGVGMANLINILDPGRIVIGGSLANQEEFIEKAFQIAQKNIFNKKGTYQFEISILKEKANLLGAAWEYFK